MRIEREIRERQQDNRITPEEIRKMYEKVHNKAKEEGKKTLHGVCDDMLGPENPDKNKDN